MTKFDFKKARTAIAKLYIIAIIAIIAVAASASAYYILTLPGPASTTSPIKIGMAVALSGGASKFGQCQAAGFNIWINVTNDRGGILINGTKRLVQGIVYDDKSVMSTSSDLSRRLITVDKCDFVMGPYTTGMVLAAAPIFAEYGKLYNVGPMSLTKAQFDQVSYSRMFSTFPVGLEPGKNYVERLFTVLLKNQSDPPKTVAILYSNANPAFVDGGVGANYWANRTGMDVLLYEEYPPTITDWTSLVSKAKDTGADMFMAAGSGSDAIPIASAIKTLDWHPKVLWLQAGVTDATFYYSLGAAAEGAITFAPWLPYTSPYSGYKDSDMFAELYNAYAAKIGIVPFVEFHSAAEYMALEVLQQAIEGANSLNDDVLINYIKTHEFNTIMGKVSIAKMIPDPFFALVQVQHGALAVIDHPDPTASLTPMVYPRP